MKMSVKGCLITALGLWGICLSPAAFGQTNENVPYEALLTRDFGTAANELQAIEKAVLSAKPAEFAPIEARLIAIVESPQATKPGKQFACQMLRTVGSPKCIPAISKLFTDEQLSHEARYVLLSMKDPAAAAALREGLGQTKGNLRIGIINTIGDRMDASSLDAVAAMLTGQDDATAKAALNAIGKIGGGGAADALDRAKPSDALKDAWARAYIQCAATLASAGDTARAEKMNQALYSGDYPIGPRIAAFTALVQIQQDRAVPLIVKLLGSDDVRLSRAAGSAIYTVHGPAATKALAQQLASMKPDDQTNLLATLATRGEAEGATEIVNKLAADKNSPARQPAIVALARLGDASSIPLLLAAMKEGGPVGADANRSLVDLKGAGVTEALVKQFESGDTSAKASLLVVLADRHQPDALPAARRAVAETNAEIRLAAYRAMGSLGEQQDIQPLVLLVLARDNAAEQKQIGQALAAIAQRQANKTAACEPVLQSMAKANTAAKIRLLDILAIMGGDAALEAVRSCLTGEPEIQKAAVQVMGGWSDLTPMPDLLKVAQNNPDATIKILALRGYLDLVETMPTPGVGRGGNRGGGGGAGMARGGAGADPRGGGGAGMGRGGRGMNAGNAKLDAYTQAMAAATTAEGKKLVLGGVGSLAQPEALKVVEPCLSDAAVQTEAYVAYDKIAQALALRQPIPEAALPALKVVAEKAPDANVRARAKATVDKLSQSSGN